MNIQQKLKEKEILNKELEEGYKANYEYYKKCQEEWEYADSEITLS